MAGVARQPPSERGKEQPAALEKGTRSGEVTKEDFFGRLQHEKPAENALAIAAYYYSQYGTAILTAKEAREIADSVGLTVPTRIDTTFSQAKRNQKSIFTNLGKARYKPTVHGEKLFKDDYGVTKGTRTKAENEVE